MQTEPTTTIANLELTEERVNSESVNTPSGRRVSLFKKIFNKENGDRLFRAIRFTGRLAVMAGLVAAVGIVALGVLQVTTALGFTAAGSLGATIGAVVGLSVVIKLMARADEVLFLIYNDVVQRKHCSTCRCL